MFDRYSSTIGRIGGVALLALLATACQPASAVETRGHAIPPASLKDVSLGKTTQADIVAQFGEPDERPPDGSLVYRSTRVRRSGGLWSHEEKVEDESVTFRFENGAVAKICRTRS